MPKDSDPQKRIGQISSLTQFSGIVPGSSYRPNRESSPAPAARKPVNINIPIDRDQHQWLNTTAALIRNNNEEPQPGYLRTYPVHLVTTAIDLLRSVDIDWSQVSNIYDLRRLLNI